MSMPKSDNPFRYFHSLPEVIRLAGSWRLNSRRSAAKS